MCDDAFVTAVFIYRRRAAKQPDRESCDHPVVVAASSDVQKLEGVVVFFVDYVTSVDSCSMIAVGSCGRTFPSAATESSFAAAVATEWWLYRVHLQMVW